MDIQFHALTFNEKKTETWDWVGYIITMEVIIGILAIVWSILCLVLFFKIWGMTDDVRTLKNYFISNADDEDPKNEVEAESKEIGTGSTIALYKPENFKVKVVGYDGYGIYECQTLDGSTKYHFKRDVLVFENGDIYTDYDKRLNNLKEGDEVILHSTGERVSIIAISDDGFLLKGNRFVEKNMVSFIE